eukprot:Rhum_TRINITY_DN14618_c14_g1::Rhum_TRINITY_DN14618_c14_g1_i1::g.106002::m.106002
MREHGRAVHGVHAFRLALGGEVAVHGVGVDEEKDAEDGEDHRLRVRLHGNGANDHPHAEEEPEHHGRHHRVDLEDVVREAVEDASVRRRVEELGGGVQQVLQHLVVQPARGATGAAEVREPGNVPRDNGPADDGAVHDRPGVVVLLEAVRLTRDEGLRPPRHPQVRVVDRRLRHAEQQRHRDPLGPPSGCLHVVQVQLQPDVARHTLLVPHEHVLARVQLGRGGRRLDLLLRLLRNHRLRLRVRLAVVRLQVRHHQGRAPGTADQQHAAVVTAAGAGLEVGQVPHRLCVGGDGRVPHRRRRAAATTLHVVVLHGCVAQNLVDALRNGARLAAHGEEELVMDAVHRAHVVLSLLLLLVLQLLHRRRLLLAPLALLLVVRGLRHADDVDAALAQLVVRALEADVALHVLVRLEQDDVVGPVQVLRLVRRQHDGLALQHAADALVHGAALRARVQGRQRIVEDVEVGVGVDRAGERDTLLLPAGQVDAPLADLGLLTLRELGQVAAELAHVGAGVVPDGVVVLRHRHVLPHRVVQEPRVLLRVRDGPAQPHAAARLVDEAEQRAQQRGLAAPGGPDDHRQLAPGDRHLLRQAQQRLGEHPVHRVLLRSLLAGLLLLVLLRRVRLRLRLLRVHLDRLRPRLRRRRRRLLRRDRRRHLRRDDDRRKLQGLQRRRRLLHDGLVSARQRDGLVRDEGGHVGAAVGGGRRLDGALAGGRAAVDVVHGRRRLEQTGDAEQRFACADPTRQQRRQRHCRRAKHAEVELCGEDDLRAQLVTLPHVDEEEGGVQEHARRQDDRDEPGVPPVLLAEDANLLLPHRVDVLQEPALPHHVLDDADAVEQLRRALDAPVLDLVQLLDGTHHHEDARGQGRDDDAKGPKGGEHVVSRKLVQAVHRVGQDERGGPDLVHAPEQLTHALGVLVDQVHLVARVEVGVRVRPRRHAQALVEDNLADDVPRVQRHAEQQVLVPRRPDLRQELAHRHQHHVRHTLAHRTGLVLHRTVAVRGLVEAAVEAAVVHGGRVRGGRRLDRDHGQVESKAAHHLGLDEAADDSHKLGNASEEQRPPERAEETGPHAGALRARAAPRRRLAVRSGGDERADLRRKHKGAVARLALEHLLAVPVAVARVLLLARVLPLHPAVVAVLVRPVHHPSHPPQASPVALLVLHGGTRGRKVVPAVRLLHLVRKAASEALHAGLCLVLHGQAAQVHLLKGIVVLRLLVGQADDVGHPQEEHARDDAGLLLACLLVRRRRLLLGLRHGVAKKRLIRLHFVARKRGVAWFSWHRATYLFFWGVFFFLLLFFFLYLVQPLYRFFFFSFRCFFS